MTTNSFTHMRENLYNNEIKTTLKEKVISQLTFTCSKSTIETLEKGVKFVQS